MPIRYAVVGLGHFAQAAILPAFKQAGKNSQLAAFVSSDPVKMKTLGRRYKVGLQYSYDQYEKCLRSGQIDAVYIALPNTLHKEFTIRAAKAGVHVLCEKPMAMNVRECEEMIRNCKDQDVRLMVAYRLHFEAANLSAIKIAQSGKIGDLRFFSSVFSHKVVPGNIRTKKTKGGGGLWDLGVYCINAARYLFRAEPESVFAFTVNQVPSRFRGVDEMATAVLRFPHGRLAQFTTSQAATDLSQYRIAGTKGDIHLEPAYDYDQGLSHQVTVDGRTTQRRFSKSDQIAAEINYFSDCVRRRKEPEPSGREGMADVRVVQALYESAKSGREVRLSPFQRRQRPNLSQKITKPPHEMPELVHAAASSR